MSFWDNEKIFVTGEQDFLSLHLVELITESGIDPESVRIRRNMATELDRIMHSSLHYEVVY